jgi:CubicO group peptidase (beta-lactamase class C family)
MWYISATTSLALVSLLLARVDPGEASISPQGQGQAPLSSPTTPDGPFTVDFSAYVEQVMEEWKVPGLAIAVIDDDHVFTKASPSPCFV